MRINELNTNHNIRTKEFQDPLQYSDKKIYTQMTLIIYMGSWDYFSKFSIIVTIFFIVIAAYITKPFFSTILFSFFVAYLLVPLYTFLENRTKHRRIAAASSVFLTIILFFLIGIRIIYFILTQISSLLNSPESVQAFIRNGTNETIKIIEANFPFFLLTLEVRLTN